MHHDKSRHAESFGCAAPPFPQVVAQAVIRFGCAAWDDCRFLGSREAQLASPAAIGLLHRDRHPLRPRAAYIACATRLPLRRFSEMQADLPVPAPWTLGEIANLAVTLPCPLGLCRV